MIDVLKLILGGGMVEHHGEFYDFDRLQMSPAPSKPVPLYVGGHTEVALRRAAKVSDGWTSAMIKFDDLVQVIDRLRTLRTEYGRSEDPFEIQTVCIDKFGSSGYAELADAGVTDIIVVRGSSTAMDSTLRSKRSRSRSGSSPRSSSAQTSSSTGKVRHERGTSRTHRGARIADGRKCETQGRVARAVRRGRMRGGSGGSVGVRSGGKGHHGREAIAAFYDMTIANTESLEFLVDDVLVCGNECVNVGTIRTTLAGNIIDARVYSCTG